MEIRRLHRHPELVDGGHAVVDEAMSTGARGLLIVTFHEDGTIEEAACGDVSVADLSVAAHRVGWIVGASLCADEWPP